MISDQNFELLEGEEIIESIHPKTGFMFRANDIFKFSFFVIWILVAIIITSFSFSGSPLYAALPIVVILYTIFKVSKIILIRYNKTVKTEYVITNKRILFCFSLEKRETLYFKDLEEINYENKGNNRGYITLGKPVDLFNGGVNFEDDQLVLDNLTDYNSTSSLIKRLYDENKKPDSTIN